MEVRELIEKLLTFEGDLEVVLYDHEYGEFYPAGEPKEIVTVVTYGNFSNKRREENVRTVLL